MLQKHSSEICIIRDGIFQRWLPQYFSSQMLISQRHAYAPPLSGGTCILFPELRKRPLWWTQPTGTGQWCYRTSGAKVVKHATHIHFSPLRVSTLELSHHVVKKPRPHRGATADVPAASQIHRADASRTYQLPEAKLAQPSSLSR